MLFDDRAYPWKLGAALALLAGLGLFSYFRGRDLQPSPTRLLTTPDRWDGAALWIPAGRVVESHSDGFTIEADDVRLDVAGTAAVGETVGVRGVFRAAGPRIEAGRVRRLPSGSWRRRWMEGVSLAVLALVLLNLRRHFRLHGPAARVEGRD